MGLYQNIFVCRKSRKACFSKIHPFTYCYMKNGWAASRLKILTATMTAIIALMSTYCLSDAVSHKTVLIHNVMVIDTYSGTKAPMDIQIQGSQITSVQPAVKRAVIAENTKIINASGLYAIPGLWDMHTHLTFEPALKDRISSLFIANGITSVRDLGGKLDDIVAFKQRAQLQKIAPTIWFSGPLIDGSPPVFDGNKKEPAMSVVAKTPEDAIRWVDILADNGVDVIKSYFMLHPDAFSALVKRAHHHNLKVTGHIPWKMTVPQALDAGIDGIEHLDGISIACARNADSLMDSKFNAMETHGNDPHSLIPILFTSVENQDPKKCASLVQLLVKQQVWVTPTLNLFAVGTVRFYEEQWHKDSQYLPVPLREKWQKLLAQTKTSLEDPSSILYKFSNLYTPWFMQTVKQMHQAGVKLLAGSDATSSIDLPGFSLHDELRVLVHAGLSPLAALQTATLHPAQFFGVEAKQGSIAAGNIADIILLDADPLIDIGNSRRINTVISRGQVFERQALDKILSDMRN